MSIMKRLAPQWYITWVMCCVLLRGTGRITLKWIEPDGTRVDTPAFVGQSLLDIAIKEEIDLEGANANGNEGEGRGLFYFVSSRF